MEHYRRRKKEREIKENPFFTLSGPGSLFSTFI